MTEETLEKQLEKIGYTNTKISYAKNGCLIEFPQDENHPPIMLLNGSFYEMGYSRGQLIHTKIDELIGGELTPMYASAGGWDLNTGQIPTMEQIIQGKKALYQVAEEKFLPAIRKETPYFLDELQGLADALKDFKSPVTWEDLVIMNCGPDDTIARANCSNFAAWNKATSNGHLIRGDNLDIIHFGFIPQSVVVTVAQPPKGYAYLQVGYFPMIVGSSYLNEKGFNYGENTSHAMDYHFPQIPHLMHGKKCALFAKNNHEAMKILEESGGTTGWNHLLCAIDSAEDFKAIVVEQSGSKLTYRQQDPQFPNVIWSTNFFNCYPGWQGYDGINMIPDQLTYWKDHPEYLQVCGMDSSPIEWEDVNTVEKWRKRIQCPRYEGYRELLKKFYGQIDAARAIEIQSDEVLTTRLSKGPITVTPPMEGLYGFKGPIQFNITFSVYCAIFDITDMNVWVAAGSQIAQQGPFWKMNFHQLQNLLPYLHS